MKNIFVLFFAVLICSSVNAQEFDSNSLAQNGALGTDAADYDAAFDELDINKDGFLSEQELLKFQEVGLSNEKDETYKVLDADGNGRVNEEEYKSFFESKAPQNASGADLSLIFKDMDSNRDGNLDFPVY